MSPSLSSLASIRAQLQQLNRRIKHEPATATAPLPLPLPLSLSPITPLSPLSPATPYDSRSQHSSFDSPAAYTDSTLPLSSASFSDSPLTVSPSSRRTVPSYPNPRYKPAAAAVAVLVTPPTIAEHGHAAADSRASHDCSAASHSCPPPSHCRSTQSQSQSHCHDIYHLAAEEAAPSPAGLLSPSVSSASTAAQRWRLEAREAQRACQLLKAQCSQLQLDKAEERRRLARREAEEERARQGREKAMDELRRDIEAMKRQLAEGRQQWEAELRVEYEEIVAAVMKDKDELEERARTETSRLQQQVEQLSVQLQDSEARVVQSEARLRQAEAATRQMDEQLQHSLSTSSSASVGAAQSELLHRVASVVLPLLPSLAQQHEQKMAEMEQRLVRLHTVLQQLSLAMHAKQRSVQHLSQQHSDDTALLQRTVAAIGQQSSEHQQLVHRLTAEHDAYCALLRAQLEEERAKGQRLARAMDEATTGRLLDGQSWERREAELRRDREELSAYYHNELDKLIAEIEQLENDKDEMAAAIGRLDAQLAAAPVAATVTQQQQQPLSSSTDEWQQRAAEMAERMGAMQAEVRAMREEITVSQQRECEMRRAVAAVRREAHDRDEDKERQLDAMRALLQQLRHEHGALALIAQRDDSDRLNSSSYSHSKHGLDESKQRAAADEQEEEAVEEDEEAPTDSDASAAADEDKENAAPVAGDGGEKLRRLLVENAAMKREVARERRKFSQLLKVRQFVQQHSSPLRHTAAVSKVAV